MTDNSSRRELEDRLFLLEEMKRREESDPLLKFTPYPKQQKFIDAVLNPEVLGECWFLAANRSGKSDAGAVAGAKLARFGNPQAKWAKGQGSSISVKDRATSGWIVSLDFPSSRDIIQPKYFDNGFMPPGATHEPFIPPREIADWRKDDQILKLKNGSIIGFKSCDSGRQKFQGAEKDYVHFDEEPPKNIYEEVVIRVGGRRLRVFGTCTLLPPEGQIGGVTWVYSEKVRPWQQGQFKRGEVQIFTASIYDNPHIPPEEIARLESIYPEGSIQRRIRLNGELIALTGGARVYGNFDARLHVRPQPEIVLRRPLAWIWDFNVEPMVSFIGQRDGDLFRVYKELFLEEGNIPEMCRWFRERHPFHRAPVYVYGDASGKERNSQSKKSNYHVILNEMRDYPAPLTLRVPETNPPISDRVNAFNRALVDETGQINIEMDPECEELILDMEQVKADKKGSIKKTTNRKDPYFWRTHASDAVGYWITFEQPIKPYEAARPVRNVQIASPYYKSVATRGSSR